RTPGSRATSRACGRPASRKKAPRWGADARGEGGEPQAVSGPCSRGAYDCWGEAVAECEGRAPEHQGQLLRFGDGGGVRPAQSPGGVPQQRTQRSLRRSLIRIKSTCPSWPFPSSLSSTRRTGNFRRSSRWCSNWFRPQGRGETEGKLASANIQRHTTQKAVRC